MEHIDKPSILNAKVMHHRLQPKKNKFTYGVYYIVFPYNRKQNLVDGLLFNVNKKALLSFFDKDHGLRQTGVESIKWALDILKAYKINDVKDNIILITLPRVLNYVFNPISFWLCYNTKNELKAVLCEVNNTFAETHTYMCFHEDQRPIEHSDKLQAQKVFHVSPFLKTEGYYEFQFNIQKNKLSININYFVDKKPILLTSFNGNIKSFTRKNLLKSIFSHPLITFKIIFLIHWQAIKILSKKIKYRSKPDQRTDNVETTKNITND